MHGMGITTEFTSHVSRETAGNDYIEALAREIE
jgi:hypothetical protein